MTLDAFKRASGFSSLQETEKVCHLAFFYWKTSGMQTFGIADVALVVAADLHVPVAADLQRVIAAYLVDPAGTLVRTARGLNISFGDA